MKTVPKDVLARALRAKLREMDEELEQFLYPPELQPLNSVDEGLKLLGGPIAVSRMFGITGQSVSAWGVRGHFPPETYVALKPRFEALGYEAPPHLFRMYQIAA